MASRGLFDERMDKRFTGRAVLTVACVLSNGPIYTRDHVARLDAMVAEHMTQPYRFVCLDDSPFPGWWAKISLFEPGRFNGRVLYLDLDVTVVGSLDEIADFPAPFVAIKDWERPTFNSSVMAWDAGVADRVYTGFTPEIMERQNYGGDQAWLTDSLPMQAQAQFFPVNWCPSYKHHCRYSVPKGAKAVVFHGQPRPWDLTKDLVLA